jgi:hypothetical protein
VVFFHADSGSWTPRRVRASRPTGADVFRIVGLPPGQDYRAVAVRNWMRAAGRPGVPATTTSAGAAFDLLPWMGRRPRKLEKNGGCADDVRPPGARSRERGRVAPGLTPRRCCVGAFGRSDCDSPEPGAGPKRVDVDPFDGGEQRTRHERDRRPLRRAEIRADLQQRRPFALRHPT